MKRIGICCFLVLLTCLLTNSGKAQRRGTRLISPPSSFLNGRSLSLTIPSGWKIVRRDTASMWTTRSYEFEVEKLRGKTSAVVSVIDRGLSEAQQKGEMNGKPFRTKSGLRGRMDDEGERWNFAVPMTQNSTALVISVSDITGKAQDCQSFARALYHSVRFVKAQRTKRVYKNW